MQRLLKILEEIRPDIDFAQETALMDDGILDSFDVVSIISELNDEFSIAIRVNELTPANFNSVNAMMKMVERLQNS